MSIPVIAGGGSSGGGSSLGPIDTYKLSWEHKALQSQQQLDKDAPMKWSSFISTHNSFNASAYTTAVSYIDPNHTYSLEDQLEMDVRQLELDIHWYFSMDGWPWEWGNRPLLCHGQSNHLGCSSYDRDLSEGLAEINSWIRRSENRDEVLIITVQDELNGNYGPAISRFNSAFGDLVYRPTSGCSSIGTNVTKQDILDAGKQIIIRGGSCNHGDWGKWTWNKVANSTQSGLANFTSYPSCGPFSRSTYDSSHVRFYGDATNINDWFGSGYSSITPDQMRNMQKCGVSLASTDALKPADGRLNAAIWSWGPGEPNNYGSGEDCAMMRSDGRWNDASCGGSRYIACSNNGGQSWKITSGKSNYNGGQNKCTAQFGSSYRFTAPVNGYQNQKLYETLQASGKGNVWMGADDKSSEGTWDVR